jgi:hypothetical protein
VCLVWHNTKSRPVVPGSAADLPADAVAVVARLVAISASGLRLGHVIPLAPVRLLINDHDLATGVQVPPAKFTALPILKGQVGTRDILPALRAPGSGPRRRYPASCGRMCCRLP